MPLTATEERKFADGRGEENFGSPRIIEFQQQQSDQSGENVSQV